MYYLFYDFLNSMLNNSAALEYSMNLLNQLVSWQHTLLTTIRNNNKMSDVLSKYEIFFDEVDKVCILQPEIAKFTNDLKEESRIYTEKIEEFQKFGTKFINMVEQLGKEVENEKIKAIGARNILQSMEKQKETHQQQLHALITEKTMESERLNIQLNSLLKTEMEQIDLLNQLTHY